MHFTRLREAADERLRRTVRGVAGRRLVPGDRGDVDHAAAAHHDLRGERGVGEPDEGEHIELDLLLLAIDRQLGEVAGGSEPCVVDDEVDRSSRVRDPRFNRRERSRVREVCGQHLDRRTVRSLQLPGELLEPPGVASDEHEVVAAVGERERERAADAGRCSGDEGNRTSVRAHGRSPSEVART
jgi:hypothetical protein